MIHAHPFLAIAALSGLLLVIGYIESLGRPRSGHVPYWNVIFAWAIVWLNLVAAPLTVGGTLGSLGLVLGIAVFAGGGMLIVRYYRGASHQ
jgi:hypothetical protein